MTEISTVFWDLDGSLVSTNCLYDKALDFACNKSGCKILQRIEDIPNGQTLVEDFSFITGLSININQEVSQLKQLENYAIDYIKNNFYFDLRIKNSLGLFNYFYQLGLKQSIVSNSNQELCDFILNKIGIKNKCSFCFGIETVKKGKPSNEPYIHAIAAHKAKETECLVFEDSKNGIKSAKAANLVVVGVGLDSRDSQPDFVWDVEQETPIIILQKLSNFYAFIRHS